MIPFASRWVKWVAESERMACHDSHNQHSGKKVAAELVPAAASLEQSPAVRLRVDQPAATEARSFLQSKRNPISSIQ